MTDYMDTAEYMDLNKVLLLDRYKNFTILDEPVVFCEWQKDNNIDLVQLHSLQDCGGDIIGFCGIFEWKNNELKPLDGDSYSKYTEVYGYSWFFRDDKKCLDILVKAW